MSVTSDGVADGKSDHRLRSNALGLIETIGQSLAAISPTLTPVLNITVVAAISLALTPIGLLDAYGCSGTFASFGFVVVYLLICIVAPMDLRRTREMQLRHVLIGAAGAALMLFVIFGYMLLGAAWFAVLKAKSPQTLASIQHDMEG